MGKSGWKKIKKWVDVQWTTVRFHAREKHYRCIVYFDSIDGEVQRRSEGATMCTCLWTWRKRITRCQEKRYVWYCMRKSGLAEKYVRIVRTRYVRWQYNSGDVCGRSDRGVRGEVGTAPRIGFEPLNCLFAMVMDRMTDDISECKERVEEKLERCFG